MLAAALFERLIELAQQLALCVVELDGHRAVQVVAIALKNVVLLEADFNVQITRGAAVGARLTIARAANAHAVVDTGRNFDFQGFLALDLSLTRAGGAGIGNDLAHTAASRAGLLHAEKALAHLHRTRAAAGAARFDLRAGFGAGARADFAVLVRRNSNLRVLAVGCFFQRELHGIAQVATTKHLASAARTSTLLAEHIAKNIAKRLGKKRILAETGAGQHGVATATVCARFGMECVIYMGRVDMERQALNVVRMRLMGAEVRPVTAGQATLKEAVNEAMRDWVASVDHTHYILGSALGAHPFPMIVRDFQRVIGLEARRQILEKEGRLPDLLIACVGGGSNAIGLFHPFLDDPGVRMVGVEAGGDGIVPERHAARFQGGKLGVLQGTKTWLLANADGQIELTHSISAGLDYAAVGPEHAYLQDTGRVQYTYATDSEALAAFKELAHTEGILPALESSHAMAGVIKLAPTLPRHAIIIANLSGRGDKDVEQASRFLLDHPA